MCWKGKRMGWSLEGGNPFKSMRNSARKQQKEQFSRNYREGKKNLARDTAWKMEHFILGWNWMFQLKMTELRSFKSSQNLIHFSWMGAAHILKTWQTLCSLEIVCSPGSVSSWHQMALPNMDQKEKKHKKAHQASCATYECRTECAERRWMSGAAAGRERVHGRKSKPALENRTPRWKKRTPRWKNRLWRKLISRRRVCERQEQSSGSGGREGGRRKRGREERPLCAWEKDNKSCGLLSRRTIPALFTVCSFNLVNF